MDGVTLWDREDMSDYEKKSLENQWRIIHLLEGLLHVQSDEELRRVRHRTHLWLELQKPRKVA